MTAAQFLWGEVNMALVHGKICHFCVIFIILMPTDGQHCAAGEAKLEV